MTRPHDAMVGLRWVIVVFPDHTHLLFDSNYNVIIDFRVNLMSSTT